MKKKRLEAAPQPPAPKKDDAPLDYEPLVSRLLDLGELRGARRGRWEKRKFDYAAMGFTSEHVPELIRMAGDARLLWADSDAAEVWAPIHAWRVLGRLRATEAVPALVERIAGLEGDDSLGEELPRVFSQIGAPSVEPLAAFVRDPRRNEHARIIAVECLQRVGLDHRDLRPACVATFTAALEEFERNEEALNGFLTLALAELDADEALPLIERAFAAEAVDEMVMGDLDEVRARFGLPPAQSIFLAA